ncbi:DUF2007 domain-containing protein [Paracoccus caeni]|uniref:DUF2007 domain-containing protein n=1 Tax=Paracoccus caeni TaxID=657651 RepID=A0A934SH15_9RHOB|nr:DUF2007 domain-containing protein [Paracoccus caeni]MBK4217707.1 DUF2007 domain-containing protein [Paracoccus caeni]
MIKDRPADFVSGGLVCLGHGYRWHEAQMTAAILQSAGIHVQLLDAETHNMMPSSGIALGGVRLVVPRAEAREALDLLLSLPPHEASRQKMWLSALFVLLFAWASVVPMMSGFYLRRPVLEKQI